MKVVAAGKVVGVAVLAAECRAVRSIEKCSGSTEVFAAPLGSIGSALRGRACFWGRDGAPQCVRKARSAPEFAAETRFRLVRSSPSLAASRWNVRRPQTPERAQRRPHQHPSPDVSAALPRDIATGGRVRNP